MAVAERMGKLESYRKLKEETGQAVIDERKGAISQMHNVLARSMFKNMEDMKSDLNGICSQISAKTALKWGIGKKFEENEYAEFRKSWDNYIERYNSVVKDPNNFEKFNDYHMALTSMIDSFDSGIRAYVQKRTDLWFRYIDNASNVLDAAIAVQVGIAIFTEGATLVTAGVTKAAQWTMKKTGKTVGTRIAKRALINLMRKKIMQSMAYRMMGSKVMMMGVIPAAIIYSSSAKPYISNEVLRPKIGKSILEGAPMLDQETRKMVMDEYGKFGSTITLDQLEGSISNVTNPVGIGTGEYMKSTAIILGSYYIIMGIPAIRQLIKSKMPPKPTVVPNPFPVQVN